MTGDCSPRFSSTTIAHAMTIAFVANIGNAFDSLVGDQFGDLFDQAGLVHLIGNFGDDNDCRDPLPCRSIIARARIVIWPRPVW